MNDAGEGDLGVIIMCDGETVQSAVSQGNDRLVHVSFEVKQSKPHKVYVTYNEEPVPGQCFHRSIYAKYFSIQF